MKKFLFIVLSLVVSFNIHSMGGIRERATQAVSTVSQFYKKHFPSDKKRMQDKLQRVKNIYVKNQEIKNPFGGDSRQNYDEFVRLHEEMRQYNFFIGDLRLNDKLFNQCIVHFKIHPHVQKKRKDQCGIVLTSKTNQEHILNLLKKLYLYDLVSTNGDIEFWSYVLSKMGIEQHNFLDTWIKIRSILDSNDPYEVELLLSTAILSVDDFYGNKPYTPFDWEEGPLLRYHLNNYLGHRDKVNPFFIDKKPKMTLSDIRVGDPKWVEDGTSSNWTNSRYFWFTVLRDMGYENFHVSKTWSELKRILKENDRAVIYDLITRAMKKIEHLERWGAWVSPEAWWESVKATYIDTREGTKDAYHGAKKSIKDSYRYIQEKI